MCMNVASKQETSINALTLLPFNLIFVVAAGKIMTGRTGDSSASDIPGLVNYMLLQNGIFCNIYYLLLPILDSSILSADYSHRRNILVLYN